MLALFLVLSGIVAWQSLLAAFSLALHDDQYTHILLILPLSLALIYRQWPAVEELRGYGGSPAGVAVMAVAAMIAIVTIVRAVAISADVAIAGRMFALVLFWIGAWAFCFGWRVVRALIFPLCFLFFLVPLPLVALGRVINLLQRGSTLSAHWLFAATGVPVSQDGFVLTIPGLSVEVAQECSSIRSSSMLLVATMVLAQVLLRSPWRKALVVAVAIPLSVAKNGLRIFTISMLGTRVDRGYLTGRLHHQGGPVFFAIALVIVFALIWLLKRGESLDQSGSVREHYGIAK